MGSLGRTGGGQRSVTRRGGERCCLGAHGQRGGGGVSSAQASERAIAVTGDGRKEDGMPRGRRTVPEDAMG